MDLYSLPPFCELIEFAGIFIPFFIVCISTALFLTDSHWVINNRINENVINTLRRASTGFIFALLIVCIPILSLIPIITCIVGMVVCELTIKF